VRLQQPDLRPAVPRAVIGDPQLPRRPQCLGQRAEKRHVHHDARSRARGEALRLEQRLRVGLGPARLRRRHGGQKPVPHRAEAARLVGRPVPLGAPRGHVERRQFRIAEPLRLEPAEVGPWQPPASAPFGIVLDLHIAEHRLEGPRHALRRAVVAAEFLDHVAERHALEPRRRHVGKAEKVGSLHVGHRASRTGDSF
jgi:hypothetical protein